MSIVCLGWGSLIWDPGKLRLGQRERPWHRDGPLLPVEFASQSFNGRLTLVIVESARPVPVLWARLAFADIDQARTNLRDREWPGRDVAEVVGVWERAGFEESTRARLIGNWAKERDIDAVVWTKLPPRFRQRPRAPSISEALAYLSELDAEKRALAEQYIRRTPLQITTPIREAIESQLGWTYDGSMTDANIDN